MKRQTSAVVGIGQTDYVDDWHAVRAGDKPFDSYGYAALAFNRAMADAGVTREEIDGLIVGPSTAYERMGEVLALNVRWGDQADAMLSVIQACQAIETGSAEVVALVYGNDQRSAKTQYGGPQAMGGDMFLSYVYHSPWGLTSQGALYALMFQRYRYLNGFDEWDLGHVAVAQREFASLNPCAIQKKRITLDDYMAARYICEPLRLFDYCLINDGGVALILAEESRARQISSNPIFIENFSRFDLNYGATSLEPRLTDFYQPAQRKAAEALFNGASIGPEDVDVFQVYDSFSVHVPLALEGYGYCRPGEAARFLREDGIGPGGRLPTNTSGGHLSESYMQGWNHQIECVRQLRGHAGKRQVEDAKFAHYSSDVAGKAVSILYSR